MCGRQVGRWQLDLKTEMSLRWLPKRQLDNKCNKSQLTLNSKFLGMAEENPFSTMNETEYADRFKSKWEHLLWPLHYFCVIIFAWRRRASKINEFLNHYCNTSVQFFYFFSLLTHLLWFNCFRDILLQSIVVFPNFTQCLQFLLATFKSIYRLRHCNAWLITQ